MAIKSKLGDIRTLAPAKDRFRQTITLVSNGYSDPALFKDGKLTVLPWDLNVNEWLHTRTQSANMSNIELTRNLLSKVTGLKLDDIDKLPLSETNLVMMVARALTWPNSTINYTPQCPHCGYVHKVASIKVPEELGRAGEKPVGYPGYDVITLPQSGDALKIRPLLVGDGVSIATRAESEIRVVSDKQAEFLRAILEINDTKPDDRNELLIYTQALPPGDIEYLSQQMQDLSPRLDDSVPHKCDNEKCGKAFTYTLNLNVDFFRR